MVTVTIPKRKYEELLEKAMRYEYVRHVLKDDIFSSPPTRDKRKILDEFEKSGKYNKKFLESLEKGMSRSSYFKK
jgi:DNA polymerase III delta prime subunit